MARRVVRHARTAGIPTLTKYSADGRGRAARYGGSADGGAALRSWRSGGKEGTGARLQFRQARARMGAVRAGPRLPARVGSAGSGGTAYRNGRVRCRGG